MKKSVLLLLLISMFIIGCGGSKKTSDKKNGKEKVIRFSWWGNDDRHQATLSMIENFEKKHDNVKIKPEYSGWSGFQEKITTQIAGNTEPDIMTVNYDWLSKFSPDGKSFYDLNKIEGLDLSTYDKEFLKFGQVKGIQDAIPLGKNAMLMALNKSVYEDLGLEIPKTWEDFKNAAKKFPKGSYPLATTNPRFIVTIYLQQKTGKGELDENGHLNYTEAEYKEALTWYENLVKLGVFASRQDILENVGNASNLAQNKKFIQGKYAGIIEWSGGLSSYEAILKNNKQELLVMPIPKIKDALGENTIAKPTMLLAVSKHTKNLEEVKSFLNDFFNGNEANKLLGVTRGIPASSAAYKALDEAGLVNGAVKTGYEYSQKISSINQTPLYENENLNSIFIHQLESFELGKSDIDKAVKNWYNETKEEVAKLSAKL